ncbi:MAG: hypothetical protein N3E51_02250 [Candidatus Micrarchaeota archaeon]|nr:hypothetical protein [Candidatus Micrarchaeota archaeon]
MGSKIRGMRLLLAVVFLLAAAQLSYSGKPAPPPSQQASPLQDVNEAVFALCNALKSLLPVVAMLMIVFGAVVYAAGQIMGAETRARANVWATAAVTGALVAMLIATVAPAVLSMMVPGVQCDVFAP